MKLANCPRCRRPFVDQGRKLCPVCLEEENGAFDTIREYLDKHPGAGLYQICSETGIDEDVVISLVHRGRLQSVERHLTHKCARCGAEVLIVDGDFCERCRRDLQGKVTKAIRELSWKADESTSEDAEATPGRQSASPTRQSHMFIRDVHRRKGDTD